MAEVNEELEQETSKVYVPGTLYIMQETDYLSGEKFDYYKIGIVRGEKDVAAREKEHSTGNPRNITSIKDIFSTAVQKLETRLHNEFARHRVSSGEWFYLSGDLLGQVITVAEQLNAELESEIEVLNSARAIAGPGEKDEITPSKELQAVGQQLADVLGQTAAIESYKKGVETKLKELAQGKPEWEHLFERRNNKERNSFSTAELKKKYKALYDEYQRIVKISVTKQFLVEPTDFETSEVLKRFELIGLEDLGDDVIALHQASLDRWSVAAQLDWEREFLEARLLTVAVDSQGIKGILKWNTKESKNFDKEAFEGEHPVEFAESFKITPATVSWRVAEWASYSKEIL